MLEQKNIAEEPSVVPPTQQVLGFRAALRGAKAGGRATGERTADASLDKLLVQISHAVLPYADSLVRNSELRGKMDGMDLVQDAWVKVMRYLSGPSGDHVQNDLHLMRVVRVAIRSRLLDLMGKSGGASGEVFLEDAASSPAGGTEAGRTPLNERLAASEDSDLLVKLPDVLQWGVGEGRHLELIQALFAGEKEFHAACVKAPRRKSRHYQAFVLCQMAHYLQEETLGGSNTEEARAATGDVAAILRAYVLYLGVPAQSWEQMEAVATTAQSGPAPTGSQAEQAHDVSQREIIQAANRVCGTNIRDRGTLTVLRYEFNQLIKSDD